MKQYRPLKRIFGSKWIDDFDNLVEEHKKLFIFSLSNIVIVIFLIMGYINIKQDLIVYVTVPNGTIVVNNTKTDSPMYFELWSRYLVGKDMFGYQTKQNIEERIKKLSARFEPNMWSKSKVMFEKYAQSTISNDIKRTLTPLSFKTDLLEDGSKGVSYINFSMNKWIGINQVEFNKYCHTRINYKIFEGEPLVTGFNTDCN